MNQVQASLIGRLKARGVTTIIYGGDPIAMGSLMAEATRQDWFPEWVMTGGFSSERTSWGRPNDPRQMRHAFGVTPLAPPAALAGQGHHPAPLPGRERREGTPGPPERPAQLGAGVPAVQRPR